MPRWRWTDFLDCETEVDALLQRAADQGHSAAVHTSGFADDKTFPYLEITTSTTSRRLTSPASRGSRAANCSDLSPTPPRPRRGQRPSEGFRSEHASWRSATRRPAKYSAPACFTRSTAAPPPAPTISRKRSTAEDIDGLKKFLASKRSVVLRQIETRNGAGR